METNRQAHQNSMQQQLDQWHARLESLEATAATAAAGAKVELQKVMEELRALQVSAKQHFDELASASADSWNDVKTSVDTRWSDVRIAVETTWIRSLAQLAPIKPEHKKELHDKVLERREQLAASLASLQADPQNAKSERAGAVEAALAALQTHMSGGWESIDEQESAALTRWLESSRFLFDGKTD
jgi:hypothetical protein